jgi:V8-like Glu-specific endopeptidase
MFVIRHRTGPLKDQEQSIDEAATEVLFGRDAEACQVIYPSDETLVSHRHFKLVRQPSGDWTFDLFGRPYVAVNRQPAENGRAVKVGDVIELGKRGGPSFEITQLDQASRAGPLTQVQDTMPGSGAMARRARQLAVIGVSLAVIAAAGVAAATYFLRTDAAEMAKKVAALDENERQRAAESIGRDVRTKLQQASYVVILRTGEGKESAVGTASPIAPNLLATNAHIVEAREKLKPGQTMLVRSPGVDGKTYEVIESRKHPGYDAFQKYLDQDPFFVESAESWLRASISYDVGVLKVADGANLGPILEIASADELAKLEPGTALAMSGYPLERIPGQEVRAIGAIPTLSIGIVTALADMFNLPAAPAYRRLVQHNLPGTGGNSGSPMLTPNGKLVALHNSGSYIEVPNVGRVPNAALVRYAQRADFLLDLVSGNADAKMAEERAYWEKQTAAFKRGIEVVVPYILDRSRPQGGAKQALVQKSEHKLGASERFVGIDPTGKGGARRHKMHTVTLTANRPATFIAYAQNKTKVKMYLWVDQTPVEKNERETWFPFFSFTPKADGKANIEVVGPDEDVNYTLFEYAWDDPRS